MRRYTAAVARERLSDVLDEADRGIPVIIERKGVRYRLAVEKSTRKPRRPRFQIEILDPAVEAGQWTWDWTRDGLRFRDTRRSK